MFDCSKEILKFYDAEVKLSQDDQSKLAGYRDANIVRLENGLKNNEKPLPESYINQGSYDMDTIIQHSENDYDIDVGILYEKSTLKNEDDSELSSLDARKMICKALQDNRFARSPEIRDNCVRIYYNEGYHLDMPVYGKHKTFLFEKLVIELATTDVNNASGKWIETDPRAVSKWFCDAVIAKSPDEYNGRQMRRIVRFIKFWAQSNLGKKKPSGFIISKLVDECYKPQNDRDDESLYNTLKAIYDRLLFNKTIEHPVIIGTYISQNKEDAIINMYENIIPSLDILDDLFNENCTRNTAMKKWKKFFNNSYFTNLLEEDSKKSISIAPVVPSSPVEKKGGDRFA